MSATSVDPQVSGGARRGACLLLPHPGGGGFSPSSLQAGACVWPRRGFSAPSRASSDLNLFPVKFPRWAQRVPNCLSRAVAISEGRPVLKDTRNTLLSPILNRPRYVVSRFCEPLTRPQKLRVLQ